MNQHVLQQNLAAIESRLAAACRRAGQARSEITLVAVTKMISAEVAAMLAALGIHHLGENRPQELRRKAAALPENVHWHLIGHLQRNKIEDVLPLVYLIHSVDSLRLLQALDKEAGKQNKAVPVLLEVNASGEANKQGFNSGDLDALVPEFQKLGHVQVKGLMTMAALQEPELCRPTFGLLRQLRDRIRGALQPPHTVEHLSMGMSNDFEVAVEEGATFIRLGTVLFQGV